MAEFIWHVKLSFNTHRIGQRSRKTVKVSWQIDYLDPDGRRVRKNFKKQKDSKAHLARHETDINDGVYVDSKKYLKATMGNWLKHTKKISDISGVTKALKDTSLTVFKTILLKTCLFTKSDIRALRFFATN